MRCSLLLALAASLVASSASAQTAPAPSDPAPDAPVTAPKPKRKPAGPRPAQAVTVINASASMATQVTITGEGKIVKTAKALAPKARALVKLPRMKGCTVAVAAAFEGEGQVEVGEFNVCKDKTIRFTD